MSAEGRQNPSRPPMRDLRVDFFRGLALWWIFTDHVPGDIVGDLSIRNFALCDATELFVFLAGYAGGIAYGGTMRRQGWFYAAADAAKRGWTLYVAHIFLFVVFSAQVAWSAAALSRADYLDEIHLDVIGNNPYRALLEALTLHFQPAYLNILPLYVVLLGGLAVILPLLRFPALLGGLSFTAYLFVRVTGWNLGSWTGGGWFFNPLAWQVLFVLGALISYNHLSISWFATRRRRAALDAVAVLTLLFGLWTIAFWGHPHWARPLPGRMVKMLYDVDKGGLHPLRLTSFLALAWLARRLVGPHVAWVRSRWARPFVIAGQNSLPVFCFGIFAAFVGRVAMEHDAGLLTQIAVNGLGAASMAAVGTLAAWYRRKEKQGRAPAPGLHVPFVKMHGLGNDFIILDERTGPVGITPQVAAALADRRTGIGCDQVICLEPVSGAAAFMRIYNPDGSQAEACGNATRCVIDLLHRKGGGRHAVIRTEAGDLPGDVREDGWITVDMGVPGFNWTEIPLARPADTLHLDVAAGMLRDAAACSIGNPHVTFRVADAGWVPLGTLGPVLEHDPLFPHRANIGVVQILTPDRLRLRVWERGAGLTRACGSGACAAVVNAVRRGWCGRTCTVVLDGGELEVAWREDGHVIMAGPSTQAFSGWVDLAAYSPVSEVLSPEKSTDWASPAKAVSISP